MSAMRMEKKIYDKGIDIKKEIKKRKAGKVDLQLGKKGPTPGFIEEVRRRLKAHGVVKIRILKSYARSVDSDRREIARQIAELVGARLIEVRGYTFILAIKKK